MIVNFKEHSISYPQLDLSPGLHLVTGVSGSGKTTLLRVLHGVQYAENAPRIPQHSAFMPQHPQWMNYATLQEQLSMIVVDSYNNDATALGIDSLLNRFPHELSIGQLQRMALLLALHQGSSTLLLDEPTSALDDDWAEKSCELLQQWLEVNPNGMVYAVTHDQRLKNWFKNAKILAL